MPVNPCRLASASVSSKLAVTPMAPGERSRNIAFLLWGEGREMMRGTGRKNKSEPSPLVGEGWGHWVSPPPFTTIVAEAAAKTNRLSRNTAR